MKKTLLLILIGLLIVSCGGSSGSYSTGSSDNDDSSEEEQTDDGNYTAQLVNINPGVPGLNAFASGNAQIEIVTDVFDITMSVQDALPGPHYQNIFFGSQCPTLAADDDNNDGFVDAVEAQAKLGEIMIPLDGDLINQAEGANVRPIADAQGSYDYRELSSQGQMIVDLHRPDPNPNDGIGKLPASENLLNLTNRVIVVHGYASSTILPATVASNRGLPANATIPIACGRITR